jgi:hypothetical protein
MEEFPALPLRPVLGLLHGDLIDMTKSAGTGGAVDGSRGDTLHLQFSCSVSQIRPFGVGARRSCAARTAGQERDEASVETSPHRRD